MPYKCCVPGCKGNYDAKHIWHIFRFPKDEELCKKWLRVLHRDTFQPKEYSRVCDVHFAKESIIWFSTYFDEKSGFRIAIHNEAIVGTEPPSMIPPPRCKEKLNTLAISVMNQWPGTRLVVTEGWDEEGEHAPDSLHYEGRAVDILTSDREKSKLGMLARLAVEAGFDWVFYESKTHIHCSVKSESSQAAKYGGCFPGDSTVLTSAGVRRRLSDLHVGERVLSHDPITKKLVFSEVILFLDYNPTERREFLSFTLKSGRTLTVTPNHLMTLRDGRTVYAGILKAGDKLLVSDSENTLSEDTIEKMTLVLRTGVFAPLTRVGTVVINDVVASCYATVDSQTLAHWAFMPLRLVWNIKLGLQRLWTVLSKPIAGWDAKTNEISRQSPPVGVHWYARILYATANYFIPDHLRVS